MAFEKLEINVEMKESDRRIRSVAEFMVKELKNLKDTVNTFDLQIQTERMYDFLRMETDLAFKRGDITPLKKYANNAVYYSPADQKLLAKLVIARVLGKLNPVTKELRKNAPFMKKDQSLDDYISQVVQNAKPHDGELQAFYTAWMDAIYNRIDSQEVSI